MPDKKLTDNEIVKALECCCGKLYCETCHYRNKGDCLTVIKFDVIDLINRLQTENERLKDISDNKTKELLRYNASIEELHKKLETAKAYKEFAEEVLLTFCEGDLYLEIEEKIFIDQVRKILKLMKGRLK